LEFLIDGCCCT